MEYGKEWPNVLIMDQVCYSSIKFLNYFVRIAYIYSLSPGKNLAWLVHN